MSVSQAAQAQTLETAQTSMIKADVRKRGVSQKARVKINLRDGSQVVGRISRIDHEFFEISNKAGETTQIKYPDVEKITRAGPSKAAKIGIGVGVGMAAVGVTAAIVAARVSFGPNWCTGRCP